MNFNYFFSNLNQIKNIIIFKNIWEDSEFDYLLNSMHFEKMFIY